MAHMPTETAAAGETIVSAMDYREHEKTYTGFLHLGKWFIYHVTLLVVSLYCFIVAVNAPVGIVLLLAAIAALGIGIFTIPRAPKPLHA
jgi:hypothetical protein